MDWYNNISLAAVVINALATSCAVIVALYGASLKQWLKRPKLKFDISKNFPYCLPPKLNNSCESNEDSGIIEICGRLINEGTNRARNVQVICTGLYINDADESKFCKPYEIRSRQFQWIEISKESVDAVIDIIRGIDYFVKIAEISKYSPLGENNKVESEPKKPVIKIASLSSGKPNYIQLEEDKNRVLIAIRVICDDSDPINLYVKIDWKGEAVKDYDIPGKLSVSYLTEEEANKLINNK